MNLNGALQETSPLMRFKCRDNVVIWNLKAPVKIMCLGDLHIGSPHLISLSLNKIKEYAREYYFLYVGDLTEMVLKSSVGNVYSQRLSPQLQVEYLDAYFSEIKDRVLGVVSGNHDRRVSKEVGLDVTKFICDKWNIPYSPYFLVVDIQLEKNTRKQSFSFALHHGVAGGRSKTASVRQSEYFERFLTHGIDIYVSGHTHKPTIVPFSHRVYNKGAKRIETKDGYLITVPSFTEDEDYALAKMLEKNALDIPVVSLDINYIKTARKTIEIGFLKFH